MPFEEVLKSESQKSFIAGRDTLWNYLYEFVLYWLYDAENSDFGLPKITCQM